MKRAALAVFVLILAVPVVAVLGAGPLLDSAGVRSRLAGALERGTGHAARLDGPVRLAWSLSPTVSVQDVVLLNPLGFSRPAFATVRQATATLALLPLLTGRVELGGVTLEGTDVLLERDAAGRGNWLPPVRAAADPVVEPAAPRTRTDVFVQQVTIRDSQLAWRGGPVLAVRSLDVSPAGGPVSGTVLLDGVPFVVQGSVVPGATKARLDGTVTGPGLSGSVAGDFGGPLTVQVRAADLSALAPLAGQDLPPLRDVQVRFALPGPTALRLTAGASALDGVMPGLAVQQLVVEAAGPDQPVHLAAVATLRQLPLALALNAVSLDALRAGGAVPVQMELNADGGAVAGQGSLDLGARTLEMTVSGRIPDLRRTGALAGLALPGLRDLVLEGRVLPRAGAPGLLLRGLRITAAQGDLAGDLALGTLPRPSLRGSLVSQRLDLDGVLDAAPATVAASPAAPATPPGPVAVAAPPGPPFAALLRADADLRLAIGQATVHGGAYRGVEARVLLQDGRLRLDPVRMTAPGGPVQAQLLADATATPPTAALVLRAPALDAAPLAAALGAPGAATGTLELDVQARAAGADWSALARTLDGHLAAAMTEGEIDNQVLARLFGPALRAASLPAELAGRSAVRCLAVRADAAAGQVALRTLALDTTKLRLEGEGSMNLVNETMDLHLRPTIRIGGASVAVPVHLTGAWRAPVPAVDRGVVAPGRFGLSIGAAAADPCPAALAAVRAR